MVNDQINYREQTHGSADHKGLHGGRSPDHISVKPRDQRNRRDPNLAMAQAKILAERSRQSRRQRGGVGQPVAEINQPRRQKQRHGVALLERDRKSAREKPKPPDGDERGVEANQIKPEGWAVTPP